MVEWPGNYVPDGFDYELFDTYTDLIISFFCNVRFFLSLNYSNLCREDYRSACSYLDKTSGVYMKPQWIDLKNGGYSFHPSNNICPSDVTPVLISGSHLSENSSERCLTPMLWGLIPRWHKVNCYPD